MKKLMALQYLRESFIVIFFLFTLNLFVQTPHIDFCKIFELIEMKYWCRVFDHSLHMFYTKRQNFLRSQVPNSNKFDIDGVCQKIRN